MDVVFTKDKVAIVNHEDQIVDVASYQVGGVTIPKLDCTHDGQKIHHMTYEQVAQVRCGGQPLPTLAVNQLLDGGMRGHFVISSYVWRDILSTAELHRG